MKVIVAAVIERSDRRILIGQRRREDTSPLKWEFPGGKVEEGETPEAALARELREELSVTLEKCAELGRTRHQYPTSPGELEIRFYATSIKESEVTPARLDDKRAEILGAAVAPDRPARLQLDDCQMHRRPADPWRRGHQDE